MYHARNVDDERDALIGIYKNQDNEEHSTGSFRTVDRMWKKYKVQTCTFGVFLIAVMFMMIAASSSLRSSLFSSDNIVRPTIKAATVKAAAAGKSYTTTYRKSGNRNDFQYDMLEEEEKISLFDQFKRDFKRNVSFFFYHIN
jgi:hypothetical protein